jgi:hypothetical protein
MTIYLFPVAVFKFCLKERGFCVPCDSIGALTFDRTSGVVSLQTFTFLNNKTALNMIYCSAYRGNLCPLCLYRESLARMPINTASEVW